MTILNLSAQNAAKQLLLDAWIAEMHQKHTNAQNVDLKDHKGVKKNGKSTGYI
jgi:hypothetical protein